MSVCPLVALLNATYAEIPTLFLCYRYLKKRSFLTSCVFWFGSCRVSVIRRTLTETTGSLTRAKRVASLPYLNRPVWLANTCKALGLVRRRTLQLTFLFKHRGSWTLSRDFALAQLLGSHRCPSECGIHSGGDSAALDISSLYPPKSWDFGQRLYHNCGTGLVKLIYLFLEEKKGNTLFWGCKSEVHSCCRKFCYNNGYQHWEPPRWPCG